MKQPNYTGLCRCGCGQRTAIAQRTNTRAGLVRGQPNQFVFGHQQRLSPSEYEIRDCGFDTPCWVWLRAKSTVGYGRIRIGPRLFQAHRVFYERAIGPVPEGLVLDHLCHNRACVNPNHLEPVPISVNSRRTTNVKLSQSDIQEILRLIGTESHASIGRRFGVTGPHIGRIAAGLHWGDHDGTSDG